MLTRKDTQPANATSCTVDVDAAEEPSATQASTDKKSEEAYTQEEKKADGPTR